LSGGKTNSEIVGGVLLRKKKEDKSSSTKNRKRTPGKTLGEKEVETRM